MVSIAEDGYNVHLQFTPDLANDWKNAMLASSELAVGNYHYLTRRVLDSMNASQLESKLWLVQTLEKFDVQPKRVALLAGWFAQYIVPLMFDTFPECEWIENFEDALNTWLLIRKGIFEDAQQKEVEMDKALDAIMPG